MTTRPLSAVVLAVALVLGSSLVAVASAPQVAADNTASNTIALGSVANADPANALLLVENGRHFWAALELQPALGGVTLTAAEPGVNFGGVFAVVGLVGRGATAAYSGVFDTSRGGSQTVRVHYDLASVGGAKAVAANLLNIIADSLGASMATGSASAAAKAIQLVMDAPGYVAIVQAMQQPGRIWGLVGAVETLLGSQTGRKAIIAGLAEFGVKVTESGLKVAASAASLFQWAYTLVDLLSAAWSGQTDGSTTFWLKGTATPQPAPTDSAPTSTPEPSPTTPTSHIPDAALVWCGNHPEAVVRAARTLGVEPPHSIQLNAQIAQAELDGDEQLAASLILKRVGGGITSTDPYLLMDWIPGWQAYSQPGFERSCMAAHEAK